jgi:hypothetical protein
LNFSERQAHTQDRGVIYAAGQGQTALDGGSSDDNSLFTKYLAPQLLVERQDVISGVLNTKEIVSRTAALVQDRDGAPHKQYPAYYDETLGGRIYLNGAPPPAMAEASVSNNVVLKSLPQTPTNAIVPTPVLAPQ